MDGRADAATVRLEALPDAAAAARRGAELIAAAAREAVAERGGCAIAVSGGTTPLPMFAALADQDVPWDELGIWQVDERIAPRGHEDRNLTHLLASLPRRARVHEMPVDGDDDGLDARATTYAVGVAGALRPRAPRSRRRRPYRVTRPGGSGARRARSRRRDHGDVPRPAADDAHPPGAG